MHVSELHRGDTVSINCGAGYGSDDAEVLAIRETDGTTFAEVRKADGDLDTLHGTAVDGYGGIGWKFRAYAPRVGLPCTVGIGADAYAYTVSEVSKSGRRITIRRAKTRTVSGSDMTGNRRVISVDDENGTTREFSRRNNGSWHPVGSGKNSGYYLALGVYSEKRDPSF